MKTFTLRRLSEVRSRTITARELLDTNRCTSTCLTADPSTIDECVCQCNGVWHGGVSHATARSNPGW